MDLSFSAATCSSFTQRLAKQPNPQSEDFRELFRFRQRLLRDRAGSIDAYDLFLVQSIHIRKHPRQTIPMVLPDNLHRDLDIGSPSQCIQKGRTSNGIAPCTLKFGLVVQAIHEDADKNIFVSGLAFGADHAQPHQSPRERRTCGRFDDSNRDPLLATVRHKEFDHVGKKNTKQRRDFATVGLYEAFGAAQDQSNSRDAG